MQLKERARDNKGPDPAVVARQHARAQGLQRLVDHYAVDAEAEAAGIHMPSPITGDGDEPPAPSNVP